MIRALYDHDAETVANCLGLIERGLRRLGIDPHAPIPRATARTMQGDPALAPLKPARPRRPGAPELKHHQVTRILELARAGRTQVEIARALGCTQGTVSKRLAKAGLTRRHRDVSLAA